MTKTNVAQRLALTTKQQERLRSLGDQIESLQAQQRAYLLAVLEGYDHTPEDFGGLSEDGTAILLRDKPAVAETVANEAPKIPARNGAG